MLRARACRAAAAVAALGAGCGGSSEGRIAFSQVEVQAYLEREVARTLPGLAVGAAACPAELPGQVGGTVTCTVVVERVAVQYDVQRLVAGRFEARPQRPIVVVRDIATAVGSKLGDPAASVRCGDVAVIQPAPGEALACDIIGGGPARAVAVRVGPDGAITVTDA